ncbi:MAG: excalibur calcium-binding domain-containing protein [Methyloceanibacter sp.]|uniref:excalibur calcium-binding domain-containing protein n=1 Tax=Methyloceanibacter sp. TaxID=1965321 RepID=UPI003C35F01B
MYALDLPRHRGLRRSRLLSRSNSRPAHTTLGHLFAYANCSTAEVVGFAPARRGKPTYWPHLDADNDGVACEP